MSYKTTDLEKKSLEVIKKHNITDIKELVTYLPCSRQTFYGHNLDKLDTIKDAIENNKILTKAKLRKKWADSDNPTVQIALYKLLGTRDERLVLSNVDITTDGKSVNNTIDYSKLSDKTLDEIAEATS